MKESSQYYDLTKILNKKDINGNEPTKRIVTGNRASGKSHAIEEHVLSSFRKKRYRQIALLCRYKYELEGICERFFSVSDWMHSGMEYRTGKISKMGYAELILNNEHVGYGLCLSASDNIKKASGLFKYIDCGIWDEFQQENNRYLPNEIMHLNSIISSVSRGEGAQGRRVPFFFFSNFISLLSPLMVDLEIERRLHSTTKFVRGEGFVFEQNLNINSYEAQMRNTATIESANNYLGGTDVKYLNDNRGSIVRVKGRYKYCENFIHNEKMYAILFFPDTKIYYCTKKVDEKCKLCYSKDVQEITQTVFLPNHTQYYRDAFGLGRFYFDSLESKSALIKYIAYGYS